MSPRPSIIQPKTSGLSFAQQLYASSIRTHVISPAPTASLPTPPTSPPLVSNSPRAPLLPNPQPPNFSSPAQSHNTSSTQDFYRSAVSSQFSQQRSGSQTGPHSPYSSSPHGSFTTSLPPSNNLPHHALHRAQSYQPVTTPHHHDSHHHRASTLMAGPSKPRGPPSLKTTLRPPSMNNVSAHISRPLDTTPALQPPALQPPALQPLAPQPVVATTPHLQLQHFGQANMAFNASYPSPPNSGPSPPTALTPAAHYLPPASQPALPSPPQQQITQQYMMQNTVVTPPPPQAMAQPQNAGPQQQPATFADLGLAAGSALGRFAMNVAGGALTASAGVQSNIGGVGGAIGSALVAEDGDFMSTLADGLLSNIGNQAGPAQHPAATQGQQFTGAMQNQAQAAPTMNYQQQLYQNANPHATQLNTQGAQPQQNSQAMLQAAYLQQLQAQQQQMQIQQQVQLQVQQQMQMQQQQAAYGQPPPQSGPPAAQEPSPFGTFLTGVGQVLSAVAESSNSEATE